MTAADLKQWKRRALKAEETVKLLQSIRATEARFESEMVHELAATRVTLREIEDAMHTLKTIASSALQTSD